jgi:hypothetical protein
MSMELNRAAVKPPLNWNVNQSLNSESGSLIPRRHQMFREYYQQIRAKKSFKSPLCTSLPISVSESPADQDLTKAGISGHNRSNAPVFTRFSAWPRRSMSHRVRTLNLMPSDAALKQALIRRSCFISKRPKVSKVSHWCPAVNHLLPYFCPGH